MGRKITPRHVRWQDLLGQELAEKLIAEAWQLVPPLAEQRVQKVRDGNKGRQLFPLRWNDFYSLSGKRLDNSPL